MGVDATKVQFAAPAYNIDKIAAYSTPTDSYPNSVGIGLSYSIPGSGSTFPTNTLKSITNPYGKRCFTTLSWSIDGTNFYNQGTSLFYYNGGAASIYTQMQVFCGCSDSLIYFYFSSSYTSNQTVYLQFAVDSPT